MSIKLPPPHLPLPFLLCGGTPHSPGYGPTPVSKPAPSALVASDPTAIPSWLGGSLCSGFSWGHLLQEVTHPAGWLDAKSPQSDTISHTARTAPMPSHLRSQAPPPFHSEGGFIQDQMHPCAGHGFSRVKSSFPMGKPWGIPAGLCNSGSGSGHSMMESP